MVPGGRISVLRYPGEPGGERPGALDTWIMGTDTLGFFLSLAGNLFPRGSSFLSLLKRCFSCLVAHSTLGKGEWVSG